jgi:ABC transporter fused permease/ATP-binding protein
VADSPDVPEADPPRRAKAASAIGRIGRLFRLAKPYRGRLYVALVALFIASGLGLVYPKFFGRAIDTAQIEADLALLDQLALGLVAVFALQSVFIFVRHYFMSWVGDRVVADLRVHVYRHLVRLEPAYFRRNRTGELLSRLSDDVGRVQSVVGQDLSIGLRNLVSLVGGVVILLFLNPRLTGIMLAVVPPLMIVITVWGKLLRRLSRRAQDQLAEAAGELQEGVSGIDTVQAFTREEFEVGRYGKAIETAFGIIARRNWMRSWFMSITSFLGFSTVAGIFWLGGRMIASGEVTTGQLTEFFMYTIVVAGSVASLAGLAGSWYQVIGSTGRIFEILDTEPAIKDAPDAVALGQCRGDVRFEHVTFAYDERDVDVLEDFDLRIAPGEVVALVGSSGSGKTTVARLLQRSWDPKRGRITLDGEPLPQLKLDDLRGHMAVVQQEPMLFSGPIRENIRYGRLDASDAEVEAAARAANAYEFIREFPEGFETRIGERGITLSGGQRQRVSIARAILRDPAILILDEATSALDSESEHLVQAALERLQEGRTTLVIAHRLSTIRDADRIVVLDHGRIVEQGDHATLVHAGGPYAKLVARQAETGGTVGAVA